jgi:hypothetical protein
MLKKIYEKISTVFNKKKNFATESNDNKSSEASKPVSGYVKYLDMLLGLSTIWLSFLMFIYSYSSLPRLDSPFFIYEIIVFMVIYFMVYFTLKKIRPVLFLFVSIFLFYLFANMALDLYQDSTNKTKTETRLNIAFENSVAKHFENILTQDLRNQLDSISQENKRLRASQKQINEKLDSMMILYHEK